MIEELKCKDCGKVIGHIDPITHEIIDESGDFNSCDICGEEICYDCTVEDNALDFNGCKNCHENLKKIRELEDRAEALGFKETWIREDADWKRQDPLWYSGPILSFEYRGIDVIVAPVGDVSLSLWKNKKQVFEFNDKRDVFCSNEKGFSFISAVFPYLKTDEDIQQQISLLSGGEKEGENGLELDNSDWFEIFLTNQITRKEIGLYEAMFNFDEIFDFEFYKNEIDSYWKKVEEITVGGER